MKLKQNHLAFSSRYVHDLEKVADAISKRPADKIPRRNVLRALQVPAIIIALIAIATILLPSKFPNWALDLAVWLMFALGAAAISFHQVRLLKVSPRGQRGPAK